MTATEINQFINKKLSIKVMFWSSTNSNVKGVHHKLIE